AWLIRVASRCGVGITLIYRSFTGWAWNPPPALVFIFTTRPQRSIGSSKCWAKFKSFLEVNQNDSSDSEYRSRVNHARSARDIPGRATGTLPAISYRRVQPLRFSAE